MIRYLILIGAIMFLLAGAMGYIKTVLECIYPDAKSDFLRAWDSYIFFGLLLLNTTERK